MRAMFLTVRQDDSCPAHKTRSLKGDRFRPIVGAKTKYRSRGASFGTRLEMGDLPQSRSSESDEDAPISPGKQHSRRKLSLLPLVFLIFYEVSGGPFGIEDSVQAGGPLLALIGFVVFPLIWSIPEALITAEMGTMFPENSGYVVWISEAFGPFWGFQQGWWKWLSGVIDNALYPILFLDYLKFAIPAVSSGPIRVVSVLVITVALTYLNYRGLTIVGWAAVGLGIFSLLPFVVMAILSLPQLKPSRWLTVDFANVDWNTYLNTLFWNLNYWDSVSTLVGEVDNPQRTLPKALFFAVLLVFGGYFIPLLAGTGSVDVVRTNWNDGYLAEIALAVGGVWLRWWMEASAALSNMGMFEAEMSSDSFQLLGMAERGLLPQVFAIRSVHGTPTLGILVSATGVLLLSFMSFQEIIAAENFLYCFGMFAEFAAFIWLRIHRPEVSRPFRIPLGTFGATLMCAPPAALLLLVMILSTWKIVIISFTAAFIGCALYPCVLFLKRKNWIQFSLSRELTLDSVEDPQNSKDCAEAEVGLLHG